MGAASRLRRGLGWEVVEGQERRAILGEAAHGSVVLRTVLAGEAAEGGLGVGAVLRFVDRVEVLLGLAVHRLRQGVEDVGGLVNPASLPTRRRPDYVQRLPEAQATVAGGELGRRGETVLVAQPEQ